MNLDKDALNRLAAMDDEQLKKNILSVAAACGADVRILEKKLSNIPALKRSIAGMSQKDIDRAMRAVGDKNAKIISDSIKNMR